MTDEQTRLLTEIRDLLISANERAEKESVDYQRYRATLKEMADEGERLRNGYYDRSLAGGRRWLRIQIAFASLIVFLELLILIAIAT